MTNLTKILTTKFGSLEIDVVKAGQSEPGITETQLGMMLGSDDPTQYVKRIRQRNSDRFDDGTFCTVVKTPDSIGRYVDTLTINRPMGRRR